MCYFQNYMFMSVNVWCVCCVTLRCVPLRCMRVCARVRALCVSWFVIVLPTRTWSAGLSMLLTVLPGSGVSVGCHCAPCPGLSPRRTATDGTRRRWTECGPSAASHSGTRPTQGFPEPGPLGEVGRKVGWYGLPWQKWGSTLLFFFMIPE